MSRAMTHGDAQDLIAAYKRAWERRDVDALMELYAPDAEHREDPFREPVTGELAIREMWTDIARKEAHVEFDAERIWISGSTVLASWHAAYTDRSNADRIRLRGFLTMELDDAWKVRRFRGWPVSRVVGKDSTLTPEPSVAGEAGHGR